MTLKELADQLNRPVKDVIKSLKRHGFRGIYKDTQEVPMSAIELVQADVFSNRLMELPSANIDQEAPKEIVKPTENGQHIEMKSRLQNASEAMHSQVNHQYTDAVNQGVNNAMAMGVLKASTENLAFISAYTEASQVLYELGINQQKALAQELVNTIADKDFLKGKTPAENFYKSSKVTADDQLKNDWMSIIQ